jgi:glycosyltransferase involved in cell wall biosynthesis
MVSVIIPNYNHARYLKERINSVLNQTYQDFELIILDDCSTDNSLQIIDEYRNYPKVSHVESNRINSGSPFRQWQKGIELAKGEWIWIAESDDYCNETFLDLTIESLEQNKTSLFFCQSYNVDENNLICNDNFEWTENIDGFNWHQPFSADGKEFIRKALQHKNVIPNASAVVFRKNAFDFKEVGKYKTCGDWLFWIHILLSSNLSYSPQLLNNFRHHPATTRNFDSIKKVFLRNMEELAIKYKLYSDHKLITKNDLKLQLKESIDSCTFIGFDSFKKICGHFNLPKAFLMQFFIRKVLLKVGLQQRALKD